MMVEITINVKTVLVDFVECPQVIEYTALFQMRFECEWLEAVLPPPLSIRKNGNEESNALYVGQLQSSNPPYVFASQKRKLLTSLAHQLPIKSDSEPSFSTPVRGICNS
jgi:hypothetical protein